MTILSLFDGTPDRNQCTQDGGSEGKFSKGFKKWRIAGAPRRFVTNGQNWQRYRV